MEPLISIIVPVYNADKYLYNCLYSLVNQTYKNIEIIVINDGSTDNSEQIIKKFKYKYKNVIALYEDNKGVSYARNKGIELAKGKYLMFVDSDDYVSTTIIEEMYNVMIEKNVNLVQCDFVKGKDLKYKFKKNMGKIEILDQSNMFDTRRCKIIPCAKLFLTKYVKNNLFEVDKSFEDEFFTYKVLYESKKIALLHRALYYYYQSPNSAMRNQSHYIKLDFMLAFDNRIMYFDERNEIKLKQISVKEYCIRLMLAYIKTNNDKYSKNDQQVFYNEFCKQYRKIKNINYFDMKERILLSLFSHFPNIFSKLWRIIK